MIWRRVRMILPKSLFGRALLIVVIPTLLVQMVTTYIFYERHWDNVSKHMALALANEIAYIGRLAENPSNRLGAMKQAERFFWMDAEWTPRSARPAEPQVRDDRALRMLTAHLRQRLAHPFSVQVLDKRPDEKIQTVIHMPGGDLSLLASRKRVTSSTTTIFVLWATGSTILFLMIAVLFLYAFYALGAFVWPGMPRSLRILKVLPLTSSFVLNTSRL